MGFFLYAQHKKDIIIHMNEPSKPKRKFIKIIILLISYLVVALVVWKLTKGMQTSPEYQQQQAQKQIEMVVKKVGELTMLPANETPQVAIIQDVEALKKTQPFFADAENGDKVLIYVQAKKAIIYRESTDKIVNIALNIDTAPDTTGQQQVTQPETPATTATQETSTSTEE